MRSREVQPAADSFQDRKGAFQLLSLLGGDAVEPRNEHRMAFGHEGAICPRTLQRRLDDNHPSICGVVVTRPKPYRCKRRTVTVTVGLLTPSSLASLVAVPAPLSQSQ